MEICRVSRDRADLRAHGLGGFELLDSLGARGVEVDVRKQRDANIERLSLGGALGEIGKVDCGAVVDGLEGAAGVEVAGGLGGSGSGGVGSRALARFDSRAEATGLQRIGGQALSKLRLGSDGGKLPPGTLCAKAGDIFWKPDRRALGGEQRGREGGRAGHVQAAHLAAADDLAAVGG